LVKGAKKKGGEEAEGSRALFWGIKRGGGKTLTKYRSGDNTQSTGKEQEWGGIFKWVFVQRQGKGGAGGPTHGHGYKIRVGRRNEIGRKKQAM